MNGKTQQQYLPPPHLPQLNENSELSVEDIRQYVEVLIPLYPNIKPGDQVTLFWEGTPTEPEVSPPRIYEVNQTDTMLATTIPGYSGWQKLKIWYHVKDVGNSQALEVTVVS